MRFLFLGKELTMNTKRSNQNIKLIAGIGIFAALAIIVSFATSFIKVQFLSLDLGDVIIVLASFIYGPVSGIFISLVSALVSFIYSGTGPWGMLMDFVSSAVFASAAAFIYKRKKTFSFAIIGIYSAVAIVTAVMVPLNILITPLYTGATTEFVLKLIPILLLPFNFAKALLNGGIVIVLYKPLVRAMRAARLIPGADSPSGGGRYTLITICIGLATLAVTVPVLVTLALMSLF